MSLDWGATRPTDVASAACHAWQDEHLAAGGNRLVPGVAIDLAVDGDGDALVQQRLQLRAAITESVQQLADVAALELEHFLPAGIGLQRAAQSHLDHHAPL